MSSTSPSQLPSPRGVDRAVDDDPVQPRPERTTPVEPIERTHRSQEPLLGDVLGTGGVMHDEIRRPVRAGPVGAIETLQRRDRPGLGGPDQGPLLAAGARHSPTIRASLRARSIAPGTSAGPAEVPRPGGEPASSSEPGARANARKERRMATNERWTGWIGFAGMLLVIIALVDFFEGLIAIIRGQYYAITPTQIVVFDLKTWGWITLIWAVIIGLTGLGLLSGQSWARWTAIVLISINFLTQLGFAGSAAYPLWALTVQISEPGRALRAHGSLERHARTGVRKHALAPGVRGVRPARGGLTPACKAVAEPLRGRDGDVAGGRDGALSPPARRLTVRRQATLISVVALFFVPATATAARFAGPPANDNRATPTAVELPATVSGTTIGATDDPKDPPPLRARP